VKPRIRFVLAACWGLFWSLVCAWLSHLLDSEHLWPGAFLAFLSTSITFLILYRDGRPAR